MPSKHQSWSTSSIQWPSNDHSRAIGRNIRTLLWIHTKLI